MSSSVLAKEPANIRFNIAVQTADKALIELAKQANTTLLFPYAIAQQEVVKPLNGVYTLEEAITRLLLGTNLELRTNDNGVMLIVERERVETPTTTVELAAVTAEKDDTLPIFERISIVGTRNAARTAYDAPVPIDIISVQSLLNQGAGNVLDALTQVLPSFNVSAQATNDAAMLVRPANLRGLASDHTLTLINGKRRHRSAVITFLGGGLSDGAQGPDISVLPASGLSQVEVLRDGAAAQYGSDAIAGVMNFVLREEAHGAQVNVQYGEYFAGDGESVQVQFNQGWRVGESGFANLTLEYFNQNPTDRSVQREDAAALANLGNSDIPNPAQTWGAPNIDYDYKFAINSALPLNAHAEWYGFALANQRKMDGGFYYRHPQLREGVFVSDAESGPQKLLVIDQDGLNNGIACPTIYTENVNIQDLSSYQAIADNTTALGQNCFAYNEWFPGGFTPRFGGVIKDGAMYTGFRGLLSNGWQYDLSVGVGYSGIDYTLTNTVNPSLGLSSPTSFKPGGAAQLEQQIATDWVYDWQYSNDLEFNVALGAEWRKETYFQKAGELASYEVGPYALDGHSGYEFSAGANGFPGYRPETSGDWGRQNFGTYIDTEARVDEKLLLGLALRLEDYSDFGTNIDGKLSLRYDMADDYAFRTSLSTGFKAPTVGQNHIINISTKYGSTGLEDQITLPPTNAVARSLGARPLKPEESTSFSFGVVGQLTDRLRFTLDYFRIALQNRISITSPIALMPENVEQLVSQGFVEADSYGSIKFFTNDFDTLTQGVDLVSHWQTAVLDIPHEFTFAVNYTNTRVENISTYPSVTPDGHVVDVANLTPSKIAMLEDNLPDLRATLTLKQWFDANQLTWRLHYYGHFYEDHLDAGAQMDIQGGARFIVDVNWLWQLSDQHSVSIGARNLLNTYPSLNPYSGEAGAKYPSTSPGGIDGGMVYAQWRSHW